jgi:hypothetical protein
MFPQARIAAKVFSRALARVNRRRPATLSVGAGNKAVPREKVAALGLTNGMNEAAETRREPEVWQSLARRVRVSARQLLRGSAVATRGMPSAGARADRRDKHFGVGSDGKNRRHTGTTAKTAASPITHHGYWVQRSTMPTR